MKIKSRITLYIVSVGFFASLVISAVLMYEALEQPIRIIDGMLYEDGRRTVSLLVKEREMGLETPEGLIGAVDTLFPYVWIDVYDVALGSTVYKSPWARFTPMETLPLGKKSIVRVKDGYQFSRTASMQKERKRVLRAARFDVESSAGLFYVQIARPMEKLYEEIVEMFIAVVTGLILSVLASFAMARIASKKIIRPIGEIKDLARKISDENLASRIPVGAEKDELSELAETLNGMLDRLQRSFSTQKEFLYDTSHELKTPLTTMRLAVESLRPRVSADDGGGEDTLSRLESQIWRMDRLVKDLLNLSAMEADGAINESKIDIGEMISGLADDYRFMAEEKGIRMTAQLPALATIIDGDREKLRRAFSNILDNAIKYNVKNGEVGVKVTETTDGVTIVVENTGASLPKEEAERVFDRLYRGEKSRTFSETGGFGLGLTIAQKAVELHKGKIFFESGEQGRNRFVIFLPANKKR